MAWIKQLTQNNILNTHEFKNEKQLPKLQTDAFGYQTDRFNKIRERINGME